MGCCVLEYRIVLSGTEELIHNSFFNVSDPACFNCTGDGVYTFNVSTSQEMSYTIQVMAFTA